MTLKQLIKRIRTIVEAHAQVKSFFHNVSLEEWLNDKRAKYAAVFLHDLGGTISTDGHSTTISFDMYIVDMVNVSENTLLNELDVQSDMLSIAQDLISQFNQPVNGWFMSSDNSFSQLLEGNTESDHDIFAGIKISFSMRLPYKQNVCIVPTI